MDTQDWARERKQLIDDIMEILRDQEDDRREADRSGTIEVNPQYFKTGTHAIIGPVDLGSSFVKEPVITYGQKPQIVRSQIRPQQSSATSYRPFLLIPYTYAFQSSEGRVDSFMLGLYAVTRPHPSARTHLVNWRAYGKASRYRKGKDVAERWIEPYNYNEARYLVEDVAENERITEEL